MKTTVTENTFMDSFGDRENFSYDGKLALFEYIEEMEEEMGIQLELDPIALCYEFVEYDSLEELHEAYEKENYPTLDVLEEHTQVIHMKGTDSFIIQSF